MTVAEPVVDAWLTVPEAAARIKASRRTVYRAIRSGELKAASINSRRDFRIAASWVDDWLRRRAEAK